MYKNTETVLTFGITLLITLSVVIIVVILTGRSVPIQAENDTYSAELSLTPADYMIVLGNEVNTACKVIVSQMSLIKDTAGGKTDKERAVKAAETAKSTIMECREVMSITRPPIGYEGDREAVIESFDNVLAALDGFIADSGDIAKTAAYADSLSVEFKILTTLQGVAYN